MIKIVCFLFIIIVTVIVINIGINEGMDNDNKNTIQNNEHKIYLCMTTIPERLIHPWFYNNLRYLLSLGTNYNIVINIPYHFKRKNIKYIIPKNIVDLSKDNNRLIIYRTKKDCGPLTKLYGSLLNNDIPNDSALLICDDDIHYLSQFINIIHKEYIKDTNKLYSYCNKNIEGYKCFMVKKNIIKPILNFKRPESCFRIDDNYITESVNRLNIDIITVKYNNKSDSFCNINKDIHDNNTPKWDELKKDDRRPMIIKCKGDFNKIN